MAVLVSGTHVRLLVGLGIVYVEIQNTVESRSANMGSIATGSDPSASNRVPTGGVLVGSSCEAIRLYRFVRWEPPAREVQSDEFEFLDGGRRDI